MKAGLGPPFFEPQASNTNGDIIVSIAMRSALILLIGLSLVCAFSFSVRGQSRRVRPVSGNERVNTREVRPSPTPSPAVSNEPAIEETDDYASVSTELVTVPVRVMDRKNRFVVGLAKESFKVFEDGVEQEIAYFTNESQPFTVALVLDMSYSSTFRIGDIQSAAIAFIDQLRPEDKVLVISFDEDVHMLTEATNDRGTIYRAIRTTRIATGTSLYDAVDMTMNARLRSIKGRKAMVLFTDGVDTTSRISHDLKNLQDAMELDALIYPIRYDTFADVQAMKNKTILIGGPDPQPPTTTNKKKTVPIPTSGPASANDIGTTVEEYEHGEQYLNRLAANTGGRIYLATTVGNLNSAFSKIASELREFYSIGYEPKGIAIPGKTRRIKVRIDRKHVAIRARDTYVVPKKKKLRSS